MSAQMLIKKKQTRPKTVLSQQEQFAISCTYFLVAELLVIGRVGEGVELNPLYPKPSGGLVNCS